MWRKHKITFQDHLKYIRNDIVNPFHVVIIHYADCAQEMHELAKHLSHTSMKVGGYEAANWKVHDKWFSVREIQVAIKDGLPSSIQDELKDNQ